MHVSDYMKPVGVGQIPKGHNHQQIKELAKMPHATQTKITVLMHIVCYKPSFCGSS